MYWGLQYQYHDLRVQRRPRFAMVKEEVHQSPYFQPTKQRRVECSPYSESSYFRRAPSSAFGAAQSLGPLLLCMSGANEDCFTTYKEGCAACVKSSLQHFACCSVFNKEWESYDGEPSEATCDAVPPPCCWRQANRRLQYSVRHLCQHRCFMRAYAPYRAWWSLRKALIREQTDGSVDKMLAGWRCILLPLSRNHNLAELVLPRIAFLKDGEAFFTEREVLKHLREQGLLRSPDEFTTSNPLRQSICRKQLRPKAINFDFPEKVGQASRSPVEVSVVQVACSKSKSDMVSSPYGLLEELFADDPWRLLLSTIFLNRTSRVQVDSILYAFLKEWPSASAVVQADVERMSSLIQPMGMRHRRSCWDYSFFQRLLEFTFFWKDSEEQ